MDPQLFGYTKTVAYDVDVSGLYPLGLAGLIARQYPWANAYSGRRSSSDGLVPPEDRAALGSVRAVYRRGDHDSPVFAVLHTQLHAGGPAAPGLWRACHICNPSHFLAASAEASFETACLRFDDSQMLTDMSRCTSSIVGLLPSLVDGRRCTCLRCVRRPVEMCSLLRVLTGLSRVHLRRADSVTMRRLSRRRRDPGAGRRTRHSLPHRRWT